MIIKGKGKAFRLIILAKLKKKYKRQIVLRGLFRPEIKYLEHRNINLSKYCQTIYKFVPLAQFSAE